MINGDKHMSDKTQSLNDVNHQALTEMQREINPEVNLDEELDKIKECLRDYMLEPDPMKRMEKWVKIQKKIGNLRKSL